MKFADHAFAACAAKGRELGRRLTKDEWLNAVQSAYETYAQPRLVAFDSQKRAERRVKLVDEAWIEELEGNPAYAGIDIKRELGKAQAWASVRGVGVSQRRFLNWLNKATVDRPIAFNGVGATSFAKPAPQGPEEPKGWREWVRANASDPSNSDKPWSALDAAAQRYILSQLNGPASVHSSRPSTDPVLERPEVPRPHHPVARQANAGAFLVGDLLSQYRKAL
jgi:hypothetical protein